MPSINPFSGKQPSSAATLPSAGSSRSSETRSMRRAPQSPLLKLPALQNLSADDRLKVLQQKLDQLAKRPDQPNQQPGPQALVLNPQQPPSPKPGSSQQPLQQWRGQSGLRRGTV